jgi:hypothetical protein
MPRICDMGQTALLPFRRKACWEFFSPEKIGRLRPGANPQSWVPEASMLSTIPPKWGKDTLTQVDLGGKVHILVCDIVSRFAKVRITMFLIVYRDRAVRFYNYKSFVNCKKKRRNSCSSYLYLNTLRTTNLLHTNVKFRTVHNECSKIPPLTSVHFAARVRRLRVIRLSWSSRFFMLSAAPKMRNSNSFQAFLCKLRPSPDPTNRNLKELRFEIQTARSRLPFSIVHVFV